MRMDEIKRILFVNSEIFPYLPESAIALSGRYAPQGIQECGKEIRAFMPRYGCINERRNQLHEVIRLSGMNIVVGESDFSLVIKVASISAAKTQVYFIDNEEYFQRKAVFTDADGKFFADNGERAIFFARGVLETVKKLRWKPDIVHCQGWISHFLPIYLKKAYKGDPLFEDAKVVLSLYNEYLDDRFCDDIVQKAMMEPLRKSDFSAFKEADGINLAKLAIQYSDGVVAGEAELDKRLTEAAGSRKIPMLRFSPINQENTAGIKNYNDFYDKILSAGSKGR